MSTTTPGLCCAGDRIRNSLQAKQAGYQLRHISSLPNLLIKSLGWDYHSMVDHVPGPGLIPTTANMLGIACVERSVISSKEHGGILALKTLR